MTVAHIDYYRDIKFYTNDLSDAAKTEIEDFAYTGNMAVSVSSPNVFALCPLRK
jgi:hypothetical protein